VFIKKMVGFIKQMTSGSPHPIRLYLCFHLLSQLTSSFQLNDHEGIWYKGSAARNHQMCVIKYCTYWPHKSL